METLVSSCPTAEASPYIPLEAEQDLRRINQQVKQEQACEEKCKHLQKRIKRAEEGYASLYEKRRKIHETSDFEVQPLNKVRTRAQDKLHQAQARIDRLELLLVDRDETIRELEERVEQLEQQKRRHNTQDDHKHHHQLTEASRGNIVVDLLDDDDNDDDKPASRTSCEVRKLREQLQSLRNAVQHLKDESAVHSELANQRQEQIDVLKQLMKQSDDEKRLLRAQITRTSTTTGRRTERYADV